MRILSTWPVLSLLFSSTAFASFDELFVKLKATADGGQQLCVGPFVEIKANSSRCWRVGAEFNQNLPSSDPDLNFTEISLQGLGLESSDRKNSFGIIIEWKGNGPGLLSVSGPEGRLFAVGQVEVDGSDSSQVSVSIEHFSDESLTGQFDRAVVFGESDPTQLRLKTKIWLERVLAPVLSQALSSSKGLQALP